MPASEPLFRAGSRTCELVCDAHLAEKRAPHLEEGAGDSAARGCPCRDARARPGVLGPHEFPDVPTPRAQPVSISVAPWGLCVPEVGARMRRRESMWGGLWSPAQLAGPRYTQGTAHPRPPAGSTAAADTTGIALRLQNRDENQGCPHLSIPWALVSPKQNIGDTGARQVCGLEPAPQVRPGVGDTAPLSSAAQADHGFRSPVATRGLCPQPCPSSPRPSGPSCGPHVLLAASDLPQTRFKLQCRGHTVVGT